MKYYKIYICIILRVLHQNRRLSIFLISPKEIIHKSIFRRPTNNIPNNFHWACSSSAHAIGTYERKKIWKEWGLYKPLISILINSTNNADTGGLDLDLQPQNLILFYQTYGSIFHFWWSNLNIKSYFGKWLGSWVFLIKYWYNHNYFFLENISHSSAHKRDIYSLPNLGDAEQVSDSPKFGLWIS